MPLDGAPLVEVAAARRRLAAASTDALLERVVELALAGHGPVVVSPGRGA